VYVPSARDRELRRYLMHYVRMTRERIRVIQRLRSLFLESAVRLPSRQKRLEQVPIRRLPAGATREVARAYQRHLEIATQLQTEARVSLLKSAATYPVFDLLQTIPYIGEIRAATLIAVICDPSRFSSRRKLWAYGGLGVVQRTSSEHRVERGRIVRDARKRGVRLSKAAQPLLKKVLLDIAIHGTRRPGILRKLFERQIKRGRRPAIARLTVARTVAAVVLAVWRSGRPFESTLFIPRKNPSGRASAAKFSQRRANVAQATALTICRPEAVSARAARGRTG
jgi:transposase